MKRLILTITITLIINTDVANAQINWQYIGRSGMIRQTSYGRFPRIGGYNLPYRRLGSRYYGRYGYGRDRTLGRIMGYGGLAMDVFQMLSGTSATDRVLNSQISATNRMLSMDEKEQAFRHQQIRAQARTSRKRVLATREIVTPITVRHRVEIEPEKTQEKKPQQDSIKTELQKEALELWKEARTLREEAREFEKKARRESDQETQRLQKEAESKRKDAEALQKEAQDLWQKAKEL